MPAYAVGMVWNPNELKTIPKSTWGIAPLFGGIASKIQTFVKKVSPCRGKFAISVIGYVLKPAQGLR